MVADEDKAAANEEESAAADATRAEADPESVVEPSNEELTEQDAPDEEFAADLREDSDPELYESAEAESSDDRVPEPVGAVTATGAKGASAARGSAQVARKDRPTAKRDAPEKPKRTGPVTFVKESVDELRKVVYPTAPQLGAYFVAVLVFVLFIILVVGLLDLGFGSFIFWLFAGA